MCLFCRSTWGPGPFCPMLQGPVWPPCHTWMEGMAGESFTRRDRLYFISVAAEGQLILPSLPLAFSSCRMKIQPILSSKCCLSSLSVWCLAPLCAPLVPPQRCWPPSSPLLVAAGDVSGWRAEKGAWLYIIYWPLSFQNKQWVILITPVSIHNWSMVNSVYYT